MFIFFLDGSSRSSQAASIGLVVLLGGLQHYGLKKYYAAVCVCGFLAAAAPGGFSRAGPRLPDAWLAGPRRLWARLVGDHAARTTASTFDGVLIRLRSMHAATWFEPSELSVSALRQAIADQPCRARAVYLERSDLERAYEASISDDGCAICTERWRSGDAFRRLPCRHCFHLECIDRWALSQAIKGVEPDCPLCKARF
ncbi:hypothetical protein M885DRAFT_511038 [Pelagophyceae sp. CCMP2097]|nr:hypothetical protein M885DRAFT_511038 [Pelagophyceae sp. CCMP2097]